MRTRKLHPPGVSDEEWTLVVSYLTLPPESCGQRRHELREVFNALRFPVKSGAPWRWLPHDFPPWEKARGIRLHVVKHRQARRGFVLLPRRWVIERSFAWASRFRRRVTDHERLPKP